jgi:fatty-acid desaturase/predicted DCC family thiol-disulfide oxidoreductase YuxK
MRNDVPTMQTGPGGACAVQGHVRWSPVKSLWWMAMAAGALLALTTHFSFSGLALGLCTTAVTLCLGHSLGMHRRFIHRAFEAPLWLERLLVYLGTLVGMAGPLGMMRTHDLRDWAQRQLQCHDYFGHRRSFLHDGWWQLHCDIELDRPPVFVLPPEIESDRFYRWLERHWLWQQLPWALLFFMLGGIGWVLWGVCFRVWVGLTGHWLIGHFAHRHGHRAWDVQHAAVQGFNVRVPGLGALGWWITGAVSFGECWHNNHHAFPASSRIGHAVHELDPGWWVLLALRGVGLVSKLALPRDLPDRPELRPLPGAQSIYPLTLLYDRRCAVCRLEMDELQARDTHSKLRFVDISQDGFDAAAWGATLAELNAVIQARDAQGRAHQGVPALRLAYAAVGRGWLVAPTDWPVLRPLFDVLYAWFARHRYGISRLMSPVIEHIAAARAARRMQRCAGGVCER